MHELSVTQNILNICLNEGRKHNVNKIVRVNIKVGELTGLVPIYIVDYFKLAAKNTIAEGAMVIVEKIPVAIECEGCNFIGNIGEGVYDCPNCNGKKYRIINGREFYVDSIEVDD